MANDRPVMALRTPLYLILAAFGVLVFISTFLPWASAESVASDVSVTGTDAGGWGVAALVVGVVIALIGVLGFFWNPFSDPEALFIAGFGLVTLVATIAKMADVASLVDPSGEFSPDAAPGVGLWLILLSAVVCVIGAAWILLSRPGAATRLS